MKNKIVAILSIFYIFTSAQLIVSAEQANCVASKDVAPSSENCSCSESGTVFITGSCPGWQFSLKGYTISDPATKGFEKYTPYSENIGTKFKCDTVFNTSRITMCYISAGAAGVLCAASCVVPTPVCVACIAGVYTGLTFSCQGCQIMSCNMARNGVPVNVIASKDFRGMCPKA